MPKAAGIVLTVIAAASIPNVIGAPRQPTVEVVTPRPLTVEVVTPRRNSRPRVRKPAKPIPAPTVSGEIPKINDPLDGVLQYYRNADSSIPGVVQYQTFSFKIVRVISGNEGIFAVYCRCETYSAATRERTIDSRRIAEIYIRGFDLSEKADKDIISLKNGATIWRVGSYKKGKRTYPKYTADRNEAQEYAGSHKKK